MAKVYFVSDYKVEGVTNYATIKDCVKYCSKKELLGIDIETSRNEEYRLLPQNVYKGGLDPYLSKVVMLQIGDLERVYVIDLRSISKEELKPLKELIHWNKDLLLVGQNLAFEGKMLAYHYDIHLHNVYDTMLAELVQYNGMNIRVGLADLAVKYLGVKKKTEWRLFEEVVKVEQITLDEALLKANEKYFTPFEVEEQVEIDKSTRMQFVKIADKPFTLEQILYGSDDIEYPLLIREKQLVGHQHLTDTHFVGSNNIRLQSRFSQVGAMMELNGLPFKPEEWTTIYDKSLEIYKERLEKLNSYVVEKYPRYSGGLFGGCNIEWSSPLQVIEFFRYLGICPKAKSKQTGQVEYTVGAKKMLTVINNKLKGAYHKDKWVEIKDKETLALAYLLVRKSQMNITTFGKDFLKYVHPLTGRCHPNYRLMLSTGRTATTNPNLLAIPVSHRSPFNTKESDWRLVVNDYSNQESRVLSSLCKDHLFLQFFNKGDAEFGSDFHSYTSAKIYQLTNPNGTLKIVPKEIPGTDENHPDFTPEMSEMRSNTKTINFGIPYGASAMSISEQLGIPIEAAEGLMKDYYETFPSLKNFLDTQREFALENGYFIYGDKVKAIYIEPDFHLLEKQQEYAEKYFFTDEYKMMSLDEREIFKENLYEQFPEIKEGYSITGKIKSRLGNKSNNYPIQGISAFQSKLALIFIRDYIIENNIKDWRICLLLHDEIVSECSAINAEKYSKIQGDMMIKAANYFCPNVKFETSGSVHYYWEH